MLSQSEAREIMAAGLHNDTYFEKQDREATRKTGFKVWGITDDYEPTVIERGFVDKAAAVAFIEECQMVGKWYVRAANQDDPDYYNSGEKGFWSSMTDDQYERFSDYMDEGGTIY